MSTGAAVRTTTTTKAQSGSVGSAHLLQRKCACGGSSSLATECDSCQSKRLLGKPLQAKLRIGASDDAYEREADRTADRVMRMAQPAKNEGAQHSEPLVQRRVANATAAEGDPVPPVVHEVLSAPGHPLDGATRAFFEPRFGHDFGRVRVHADSKAADSAQSVDALAYTVGNHVVFGRGQSPSRELLAHELTHVVQQGGHQSATGEVLQRFSGAEAASGCGQGSGTDTITFAADLKSNERTVQLHYHKEDPPPGATRIFFEDLSTLFPSHPLIELATGHSCGSWLRFDISDVAPGWQGPSLAEDSMMLWALAPPPSPGTTTTELLQKKGESELVFLAEPLLADFIVHRRGVDAPKDEAFDIRVIDSFLQGIGEGLGDDFAQKWSELMQAYADHALSLPLMQHRLWLGAMDGIAEEAAETLVFLRQFADDPERFIDQLMRAIRMGIMQPQSTSRSFGQALGEDLRDQIVTLLGARGPGEFLYELGKISGPILLEVVLSVLAPEASVLRGLPMVGGKLRTLVSKFFDLSEVGPPQWKSVIAKHLHDPLALKQTGEILRTGWLRLNNGHRIRINHNGLEQCSSCSILARVYQPVLMRDDLTGVDALKAEVMQLQKDIDYLLSEGMTRNEALVELNPRITTLIRDLQQLASRHRISLDPQDERIHDFVDLRLAGRENADELIRSFLALSVEAKAKVAAMSEAVQGQFTNLWTRGRADWREAADAILNDPNLTSDEQLARAFEFTRGTELKKEGALEKVIRRARVPLLKPGSTWRNPGFQISRPGSIPERGRIDPRLLRYGQDNVSPTFSTGQPLQAFADLLSDPDTSWEMALAQLFGPRAATEIEITKVGGQPFTLDHRRVTCAQAAFAVRGGIRVPYRVLPFHSLPPAHMEKFAALKRLFILQSPDWPPRAGDANAAALINDLLREHPQLGLSISISK